MEKAPLLRGFLNLERAKGIEPVSLACQSVPNPLNTGFLLPSPARFVSIRHSDFDTRPFISSIELILFITFIAFIDEPKILDLFNLFIR